MLESLDAHAHLDVRGHPAPFDASGFVLAQTVSLAQAQVAHERTDARVSWGVGCHPRLTRAQADFSRDAFARLVIGSAVVGEVGLDSGSRVPAADQLRTFRAILDVVTEQPRLVSIHSFRATSAVLDELEQRPIKAPILHWWTGRAEETRRAVRLGCHFSVHSAVARWSTFDNNVPLDRILIESDHGEPDPPAAIPLRVGWVEHLVAQRYRISPEDVRRAAWQNLAALVGLTATAPLLPAAFSRMLGPVANGPAGRVRDSSQPARGW